MFDMMGTRVLKTSFIGAAVNNINLPNLNKGVYIVKVVSEIGITNKKLIIDGININVVTVMAYLIASISPLFDLNKSINHPVILGPKPKPIIFKIKKNNAVDIAL